MYIIILHFFREIIVRFAGEEWREVHDCVWLCTQLSWPLHGCRL